MKWLRNDIHLFFDEIPSNNGAMFHYRDAENMNRFVIILKGVLVSRCDRGSIKSVLSRVDKVHTPEEIAVRNTVKLGLRLCTIWMDQEILSINSGCESWMESLSDLQRMLNSTWECRVKMIGSMEMNIWWLPILIVFFYLLELFIWFCSDYFSVSLSFRRYVFIAM